MTEDVELGILENGPHAGLIREIAEKCIRDEAVQAIWVGGSLASGRGDLYSDIDFRIAVEPGQLDPWVDPDWTEYLPDQGQPAGGVFMRFGDQALLHHLVLEDGTIVDFYVQDTDRRNQEPNVVILACRNGAFREVLGGFATPAAELSKEIEAATAQRFFVDYWITTHKQMKALARRYDFSPFVGLYHERVALLRAIYMHVVGKDIQSRVTLHMLGAVKRGLDGQLTDQQQQILGMPSRTPAETVTAIEAIRAEMGTLGRELAARHQFEYPHHLEAVVWQAWRESKALLTRR